MIFDAIGHIAVGQVASNLTITLSASAGSFSVTGIPAVFRLTQRMTAGSGSFVLTGNDASYDRDFVNWYPLADPTAAWTTEAARSSVWTNKTVPTTTWTDDDAQSIPPPVEGV